MNTNLPIKVDKFVNKGKNTLYINNIKYSGNLSEFNRAEPEIPIILKTGEFTTFSIIFQPESEGTFKLEVSLVTNDPDTSEQTFTFTVTGTGTLSAIPDIKVTYRLSGD